MILETTGGDGDIVEELSVEGYRRLRHGLQLGDQFVHTDRGSCRGCRRRGEHHRRLDPVGGQGASEVADEGVHGLRADAVDLVEHEEMGAVIRRQRGEIVTVEPGVSILLGIRDPDDHIYQGEQGVDPVAVLDHDAVGVGQIDHADPRAVMSRPFGDPDRLEERGQGTLPIGGDRRHRPARGGTDPTCLRDLVAGDGIDER